MGFAIWPTGRRFDRSFGCCHCFVLFVYYCWSFVYGWDIKVKDVTNDAQEREFFNQVKYTVQSGFAKDASLRLRHSYYRASDEYQAGNYIGDTNEWRIWLDIPVKFF